MKTVVTGQWNMLQESYRLSNRVNEITAVFQDKFLLEKYDKDDILLSLDFNAQTTDFIHYTFADELKVKHVRELFRLIGERGIHPNDLCFLAMNTMILQKFDSFIRDTLRERTTTTFEDQETHDYLKRQCPDRAKFKMEVDKIRRSKKLNFWMNKGTTKLSTIHSFKGWEINHLVLIIEKQNNEDSEGELSPEIHELIYTGLTRCKRNLMIINLGNADYHSFFSEHKAWFDRFAEL